MGGVLRDVKKEDDWVKVKAVDTYASQDPRPRRLSESSQQRLARMFLIDLCTVAHRLLGRGDRRQWNSVTWESKSSVRAMGAFDFAGYVGEQVVASRLPGRMMSYQGQPSSECKRLDPRRQRTGGKSDPREDEVDDGRCSIPCLLAGAVMGSMNGGIFGPPSFPMGTIDAVHRIRTN